MRTMAMKYAGKCSKCGKGLIAGAMAGYEVTEVEGSEKKKWTFYCSGCANDSVASSTVAAVNTAELEKINELIKAGLVTALDSEKPIESPTEKPTRDWTKILSKTKEEATADWANLASNVIASAQKVIADNKATIHSTRHNPDDLGFWANNAQWR